AARGGDRRRRDRRRPARASAGGAVALALPAIVLPVGGTRGLHVGDGGAGMAEDAVVAPGRLALVGGRRRGPGWCPDLPPLRLPPHAGQRLGSAGDARRDPAAT